MGLNGVTELQKQKLSTVGITGRGAEEFDPEMVDIIVDLYKQGFKTLESCAGHTSHPCSSNRKSGNIIFKPNKIRTLSGYNQAILILRKHGLHIVGDPIDMRKWGIIFFLPIGRPNPRQRRKK